MSNNSQHVQNQEFPHQARPPKPSPPEVLNSGHKPQQHLRRLPPPHHFQSAHSPDVSTLKHIQSTSSLHPELSFHGLALGLLRQPLSWSPCFCPGPSAEHVVCSGQRSQSESAKHTSSHSTPLLKTSQRLTNSFRINKRPSPHYDPTRPHDWAKFVSLPLAPTSLTTTCGILATLAHLPFLLHCFWVLVKTYLCLQ